MGLMAVRPLVFSEWHFRRLVSHCCAAPDARNLGDLMLYALIRGCLNASGPMACGRRNRRNRKRKGKGKRKSKQNEKHKDKEREREREKDRNSKKGRYQTSERTNDRRIESKNQEGLNNSNKPIQVQGYVSYSDVKLTAVDCWHITKSRPQDSCGILLDAMQGMGYRLSAECMRARDRSILRPHFLQSKQYTLVRTQ